MKRQDDIAAAAAPLSIELYLAAPKERAKRWQAAVHSYSRRGDQIYLASKVIANAFWLTDQVVDGIDQREEFEDSLREMLAAFKTAAAVDAVFDTVQGKPGRGQ